MYSMETTITVHSYFYASQYIHNCQLRYKELKAMHFQQVVKERTRQRSVVDINEHSHGSPRNHNLERLFGQKN